MRFFSRSKKYLAVVGLAKNNASNKSNLVLTICHIAAWVLNCVCTKCKHAHAQIKALHVVKCLF